MTVLRLVKRNSNHYKQRLVLFQKISAFLLCTLLLLVSGEVLGQKVLSRSHDSSRPWVKGTLPELHSGTYYAIGRGSGSQLDTAKKNARLAFIQDEAQGKGITITGRVS